MSLDRVLYRFDDLMSKRQFSEAEDLLLYWKKELDDGHGHNNLFKILNELVGYYRKVANPTKGIIAIEELNRFIISNHLEQDFSASTGYINIATALSSFNKYQESINFFKKAKEIYEKHFDIYKLISENENHINDEFIEKYASLCNNMATTILNLGDLDTSIYYNKKALEYNTYLKDGDLNSAITCLNLANVIEKKEGLEKGEEEIMKLLNDTKDYLEKHNTEETQHYVYVMQKCVPAFDYYGFFYYANVLRKRIKDINSK